MLEFCQSPVLTNSDSGKYFLQCLVVSFILYYFLEIKKYFNITFSWYFMSSWLVFFIYIHIFYIFKCGFFIWSENVVKN